MSPSYLKPLIRYRKGFKYARIIKCFNLLERLNMSVDVQYFSVTGLKLSLPLLIHSLQGEQTSFSELIRNTFVQAINVRALPNNPGGTVGFLMAPAPVAPFAALGNYLAIFVKDNYLFIPPTLAGTVRTVEPRVLYNFNSTIQLWEGGDSDLLSLDGNIINNPFSSPIPPLRLVGYSTVDYSLQVIPLSGTGADYDFNVGADLNTTGSDDEPPFSYTKTGAVRFVGVTAETIPANGLGRIMKRGYFRLPVAMLATSGTLVNNEVIYVRVLNVSANGIPSLFSTGYADNTATTSMVVGGVTYNITSIQVARFIATVGSLATLSLDLLDTLTITQI